MSFIVSLNRRGKGYTKVAFVQSHDSNSFLYWRVLSPQGNDNVEIRKHQIFSVQIPCISSLAYSSVIYQTLSEAVYWQSSLTQKTQRRQMWHNIGIMSLQKAKKKICASIEMGNSSWMLLSHLVRADHGSHCNEATLSETELKEHNDHTSKQLMYIQFYDAMTLKFSSWTQEQRHP